MFIVHLLKWSCNFYLSFNVVYLISKFAYVEPSLHHPKGKFFIVMENPFNVSEFNLWIFVKLCILSKDFPGGSVVKNLPVNAGDAEFNPWVQKIPWRRKWQSTPVFLPEKFHGQRSLRGYSPWGCRVGHNWVAEHAHTLSKASYRSNRILIRDRQRDRDRQIWGWLYVKYKLKSLYNLILAVMPIYL